MIIGIDASKASEKKKTGIDNMIYQLILSLKKIDNQNTYYLYTNKKLPSELLSKNFIEKLIPFAKFWSRFRLPLAILQDKPEVFLETTYFLPAFCPKNSVGFIHDLAFKYFPEAYSKIELMQQEDAIRNTVKRAERLVFSSQSNCDDFLKFYSFPKEKIEIVPLAYNSTLFSNVNNPKDVLKLNAPYFLFIGRIEKKKNILKLVQAFEIFKKNSKTNHKLVLVGKNGFGFEEINEAIASSPNNKDILLAGYIKDEDLPHLYSKSTAFIFPSLYEGFGIPILEAFACGTPVITSKIPTIEEIASNYAEFVNPNDINEIAKSMATLSTDDKKREKMIKNAQIYVKKFTWEETAKNILNILKSYEK